MQVTDHMVNRFLTWPVPASVYPDGTPGQPGRSGTNLLNAEQARAMLAHVLGAFKDRPMDTFIQPKITGYRQLSEQDAALMNEIKAHAEATRELVNRVRHHIEAELAKPLPEGHAPHSQVTHPARWAAEAQTDLQKGFMCLVRAVAQPSTF